MPLMFLPSSYVDVCIHQHAHPRDELKQGNQRRKRMEGRRCDHTTRNLNFMAGLSGSSSSNNVKVSVAFLQRHCNFLDLRAARVSWNCKGVHTHMYVYIYIYIYIYVYIYVFVYASSSCDHWGWGGVAPLSSTKEGPMRLFGLNGSNILSHALQWSPLSLDRTPTFSKDEGGGDVWGVGRGTRGSFLFRHCALHILLLFSSGSREIHFCQSLFRSLWG